MLITWFKSLVKAHKGYKDGRNIRPCCKVHIPKKGAEHLQPFFYDTVAMWTRPLGKSRLRRPPNADVPVRLHQPDGRCCLTGHRVSNFFTCKNGNGTFQNLPKLPKVPVEPRADV